MLVHPSAIGQAEVAWASSLNALVLASSADLRAATASQADSATRANAYSTPLSVVPQDRRAAMVAAAGGITAIWTSR